MRRRRVMTSRRPHQEMLGLYRSIRTAHEDVAEGAAEVEVAEVLVVAEAERRSRTR